MATKEQIKYFTQYKKINAWNRDPIHLYRHMECKACGCMTETSEETIAVTCSICVNQLTGAPDIIIKNKSGKPPGWHFMNIYVHKDGTVFYKGTEQPELKGTLPITKPKPKAKAKVKITKFQKAEARTKIFAQMHSLKKELKKAKLKKDIKRIDKSISRLLRDLKKYK
jgi:hypothetical protein